MYNLNLIKVVEMMDRLFWFWIEKTSRFHNKHMWPRLLSKITSVHQVVTLIASIYRGGYRGGG